MNQHRESRSKPRVLLFIAACNDRKTIPGVLRRIPASLSFLYDIEVLIIDNASQDSTFAETYAISREPDLSFPVRILFNLADQGYGGKQKLAYQYALHHDPDFVVLLLSDGQYPPESLPEMLEPLQHSEAEAVLASGRKLSVAMRVAPWIGNHLLHTNLTDFHSPYRAYSVAALRSIPFDRNSNDFHFDAEIIAQMLIAGRPLKELEIPAYSGRHSTNVRDVTCATRFLVTAFKARLQELSLFYDRRFDCAPAETYTPYTPKLDYDSPHTTAFEKIQPGARVLDLGCAGGYLGARLRQRKHCHVTGIDIKAVPEGVLDQFEVCDLNIGLLELDANRFDAVLLLDVVEHLTRPEFFLENLRRKMALNPSLELMISTGNIACFVTRAMLLAGQFNYGPRGILDVTHTRLFTFTSFRRALVQAGFDVLETKGVPAPYPLAIGDNFLSRTLLAINRILIRFSRGLFSYQIFMRVKARPSLELLLDMAERESNFRTSLIELGDGLTCVPGVDVEVPTTTPAHNTGDMPIQRLGDHLKTAIHDHLKIGQQNFSG